VPDVIIPDPEPGQKCHVLFKKQGMFAKDQEVFYDCDKSKKWLFLDKEGGFWSNPKYWLDNYVRKDGSKKGETLCSAKLSIDRFKKYDVKAKEDSDSSGSDSSEDDVEVEVNKHKLKFKWAQCIMVRFYDSRDMSKQIAVVKVKAKGKAKKVTTTTEKTITDRDAEGNKIGEHVEKDVDIKITKKVKKVKYTITELNDSKEDLPPIVLEGKPNANAYKLKWTGPVFTAEIDSSAWGSTEIEVKTEWKNPALGMLMGYIVAKEISPDDIKDNVHVF